MPTITEQDLNKHIAARGFGPLYLLSGDEKLTLKRAARKLIEKSSGEGFPEFNRSIFTNDSDMEGVAAAVEALPFMAEHKCAAVSDSGYPRKEVTKVEKIS